MMEYTPIELLGTGFLWGLMFWLIIVGGMFMYVLRDKKLTAKEANKLSTRANNSVAEIAIKHILTKIRDAALQGDTYIANRTDTWTYSELKEIQKLLIKQGFRIESCVNGFIIHWNTSNCKDLNWWQSLFIF